jgi:hypothetical protein
MFNATKCVGIILHIIYLSLGEYCHSKLHHVLSLYDVNGMEKTIFTIR